jgi:hypothetical protein
MYRTDGEGHIDNRFVDGDPSIPTMATQVPAAWLTTIQEEIANVVEAGGVTLDKTDEGQLLEALNAQYPRLDAENTFPKAQTFNAPVSFGGEVTYTSGRFVKVLKTGAEAIARWANSSGGIILFEASTLDNYIGNDASFPEQFAFRFEPRPRASVYSVRILNSCDGAGGLNTMSLSLVSSSGSGLTYTSINADPTLTFPNLGPTTKSWTNIPLAAGTHTIPSGGFLLFTAKMNTMVGHLLAKIFAVEVTYLVNGLSE